MKREYIDEKIRAKLKGITYDVFWIYMIAVFAQLCLWPEKITLHIIGIIIAVIMLAVCSGRKDTDKDISK